MEAGREVEQHSVGEGGGEVKGCDPLPLHYLIHAPHTAAPGLTDTALLGATARRALLQGLRPGALHLSPGGGGPGGGRRGGSWGRGGLLSGSVLLTLLFLLPLLLLRVS